MTAVFDPAAGRPDEKCVYCGRSLAASRAKSVLIAIGQRAHRRCVRESRQIARGVRGRA